MATIKYTLYTRHIFYSVLSWEFLHRADSLFIKHVGMNVLFLKEEIQYQLSKGQYENILGPIPITILMNVLCIYLQSVK